MLAGIYYGAQYGGTITSVLLRLPGEASLGGDRLRRLRPGQAGQGRHRPRYRRHRLLRRRHRLDHRCSASAPRWSLAGRSTSVRPSTPPSPCSACCSSPPSAAATGQGARRRRDRPAARHRRDATASATPSASRFDSLQLPSGIDFVVVAMGLFGVAEILYNLEERHGKAHVPAAIDNIWPSRKDLKQAGPAIGRGSVIGFFLGVLPGGGAVMASLAAYATEKRISKTPERFGRGAIEGVAAPESRQQRGRHLVLHPAAHHRHPRQRLDGDAVRGPARPRHHARPAADRGATRPVLGRHQLDVHRQPAAAAS